MVHLLGEYYNDHKSVDQSDTADAYDPDCKAIVNPNLLICVSPSLLRFLWTDRLVDLLQLLHRANKFNQI